MPALNPHGVWDTTLVNKVAGGSTLAALATALQAKLSDASWKTAHAAALEVPPSDYHQWAEAWAGQSIHQAHAAYTGVNHFGPTEPDPQHGGSITTTSITLPHDYRSAEIDRATTQLVAAAVHLTALLNHIQWQ